MLFAPQVSIAAAVPKVPLTLSEIATSMQFDPVPDVPEQPAVTVPPPEPPMA
jgi:hypothetical protein